MIHTRVKKYAGAGILCFFLVLPQGSASAQQVRNARQAKIMYNEGVRQQNRGNYEQAAALFRSSISFDSLYVPPHERLQDISLMRVKADSVRTVYDRLKKSHPGSAVYAYLAARLLDVEDAEEEYRKVIELDSLFYWGYVGLGQNFLTKGLFEEAAGQFRRAVALNPAVPDGQLALGIALENLGRDDKAERQYRKTLLTNPAIIPEAYFHLGMLSLQQGDTTECLENLENFLALVREGSQADFAQAQVDTLHAVMARAAALEEIRKIEAELEANEKDKKK